MNDLRTAPAIVVMGVAGCGKTAVGEALAKALGAVFIEGDRLHPPENVARMARGEPLTDALREGWLDAIGERVASSVAGRRKAVAACSAWCGVKKSLVHSHTLPAMSYSPYPFGGKLPTGDVPS